MRKTGLISCWFFMLILLLPMNGSFAVGSVYEPSLTPHRMTLFSSGEKLCTVPDGMLVEYKGQIYVDLERFYLMMGYEVFWYPESEYILFKSYNHRVLYMANTSVFNEYGSFFAKSEEPASRGEGPEKIGADLPLGSPLLLSKGRFYAALPDVLKVFGFRYSLQQYGTIEMGNIDRLRGYHTTRSEVKNFARILYYETRDSSIFKKTAVGGVIMNRVNSPDWPNTVDDVIFAPYQFPPVHYSGFQTLEPEDVQYEGAVRSLNGENTAPGCFFFNLAPFPGKETDFYQLIEGDYFYY